ncbi:alginate O-acetyltransferase complex protein AlgI [Keratinibaculum paraultunense]|uniref:Alginate O-acetyltransferase complex protein AlgI n=1 Tax=Keratinibaculum paraultunense TaxID=1278232 RepID=A0A4R3KRB5_9FIRM|nr:MBOAT family O-acyltransferase [Keratinibaculum paraultunense]QQY78817.1 MBOAT family protein [Keratinibaculum paraultunense]TCS87472.1 alginate O-acetyltransferase complex protein AlgI [Keratinibaculum paraultunense]
MVFSSVTFIYYFLPVVLLMYYLVPDKYKNLFFLLASLFFYTWGEFKYILLIIISIIANYFFGILFKNKKITKKYILIFACIFNIGLLGIFKYASFFINTINNVFNMNIIIPNIRLPLGISFFTFQALSYIIDVYRGEVPVQTKITDLALYIVAFPQLIAGPIVRYNTVNEQIQCRSHTSEKFSEGIKRFLLGLGKKTLLANPLAAVADASFGAIGNLTLLSSWLGLIAYTFQIYYDFSGYSDMAIGLGKMFGFEYEENFNYPYISKSVTEFWRRWHISLGTWFRDYVYIPLGGSRVGKVKNIRNLFIVWFLTGMWHGASWNFVIWGLYFGVLIFIERASKDFREKIPSYINMIVTFFLVMIGWVFFRAENYYLAYFKVLFNIGNIDLIDAQSRINFHDNIVILIFSFILATPLFKNLVNRLYKKLNKVLIDLIDTMFYIFILLMSTIYLVNSTYNPFIYFRF